MSSKHADLLAAAEVALMEAEAGGDDQELYFAQEALKGVRQTIRTVRTWSDCSCIHGAIERDTARSAASADYHVKQRVEQDDLAGIDRERFTLDTFDPALLKGGQKLLETTRGWLDAIMPYSFSPGYHDKPRACLYFYSPGKGRGKTHLAVALANEAAARGKSIAFADEVAYIERYWATDFEQRARVSAYPGQTAWLTVLDDLGQRENAPAGLRDAWYAVLNPRWLKRGWLIVTSNWTPEELLSRGTINEATHSRLVQMMDGRMMTFDGDDQRLARTNEEDSQ